MNENCVVKLFCGLEVGTLVSCVDMCAQGTVRHGAYGTVRHGTARYGTLQHGTAWYGTVRSARHGMGLLAWCSYVSTINMELQFRCHFQEVRKSAAIYRHFHVLLVVKC